MRWLRCILLVALFGVWSSGMAFAVELHMYAGAAFREPLDVLVAKFEKETGHKVSVEYGGMGQLVTRFNAAGSGDVFFSGSANYVDGLEKDGKIASRFPVARHTAVFAVRKDKAAGVTTIKDVAERPFTLGMGDPQAIALGKSGETLLDKSGYGQALREKVTVRATTIKQLLLYLLNGDVDAAVIGRADAVRNQDKLVILPSPQGVPEEVSTVAVLRTSMHPDVAQAFVTYLLTPEHKHVFVEYGFLPLEGDT